MPNTSESIDSQPRRTFRYPSIPFYLKAILLTCVGTAAYVMLRGGRLREEVSSEKDSNAGTFSIKLADIPTVTDSTPFFAHPTVNSFAGLIPSITDVTLSEASLPLISSASENTEEKELDTTSFSAQRHLLQVSTQKNNEPVVVANPVPDQFIQIGERYTYDVSKVFSGDYLRIQTNGLPSWLNLEYNKLGSYSANGGSAQKVAVLGNTVFVANAKAGIQIFNVSNLGVPQLLSTYPSGDGFAIDVAVSGNTVFVANTNGGVQILDVSNLRSPQLLSTYPGVSYGVTVLDNILFVANYDAGLLILNVSNLRSPQPLGTYPTSGGLAVGVTISGNILFVGNYNRGLLILNVSNPTDPQLLSSYLLSGDTFKVAVLGNIVFVPTYNKFWILNVTDPKNPKLLSTYPVNGGYAYGVAISSNILFAANYNEGLLVLDVNNCT